MSTPAESFYPELLRDLVDKAQAMLVRDHAVEASQATVIAHAIAELLRSEWAGQQMYIPKGTQWEAEQRKAAVWNDFTGTNHAELARKHKLAVSRIYDILAEMRERARREQQPPLFPDG